MVSGTTWTLNVLFTVSDQRLFDAAVSPVMHKITYAIKNKKRMPTFR